MKSTSTSVGLILNRLSVVGLFALGACSKGREVPASIADLPAAPPVISGDGTTGPDVAPSDIPQGGSKPIELSNGAEVEVSHSDGRIYFPVEGIYDSASFTQIRNAAQKLPESERNAVLSREIRNVISQLEIQGAVLVSVYPEYGYFRILYPYSKDLLAPAGRLSVRGGVILTPSVLDRDSLKMAKAYTPEALGLGAVTLRDGVGGFSGLERIGAPEFVELAEADIGAGATVNGATVRLGVTDTGITLNHPTFRGADRKTPRITYMKDFTDEGTVYFNPAAQFKWEPSQDGSSEGTIRAEVLAVSRWSRGVVGDSFQSVSLKAKLSTEIQSALGDPALKAVLGFIEESGYQSMYDSVDMNANGETNDRFPVILFLGESSEKDQAYVDFSGQGDFRSVSAMGDWNFTRRAARVYSELIGVEIKQTEVPSTRPGQKVPVRALTVVGFDPGNHGSHVSGIAAGRCTFSNDCESTLARGVAPAAPIMMARICSNNGGCMASEAIVDLVKSGAEVINMSIGGLSPYNDGYSAQETLINRLVTQENVAFVISAGNSGPGRQTVGSPSTARYSISVGATASAGMIQSQYGWPGEAEDDGSEKDFMLFFSSRGPTAAGGFKPNLSAPGTQMSAVQLNGAAGSRTGMDVYWGTSMSAPMVAGAYALFLDAVKKYNIHHSDRKLPTDVLTLRRVLIDSTRPFGLDQYTWADQGTGMLNLPEAWKRLLALRDAEVPSAVVAADGTKVDLDYPFYTSHTGPNGIPYDGSTRRQNGEAAFGMGYVLDPMQSERLLPVYIGRRLPEKFASGDEAGELNLQLVTSADRFVLRPVYYGADSTPWLKVGVVGQVDCESSAEERIFTLAGRGAEIVNGSDSAKIDPFVPSTFYACVDRQKVAALSPGDYGVLVHAYRTAGSRTEPVASFTIPFFMTVPHKTLDDSTRFEISGRVKSFGVKRHYVHVPESTTRVFVTLEVPAIKAGEQCSGVEMMALLGGNLMNPFQSRSQTRVANCDGRGRPLPEGASGRVLKFGVDMSKVPTGKTWDLHVFGRFNFKESDYKLTIDYVAAEADVSKIEGSAEALSGSFMVSTRKSSIESKPSDTKSSYSMVGFIHESTVEVQSDQSLDVEGPLGVVRRYPAGLGGVAVVTRGLPGAGDVDIEILECMGEGTDVEKLTCNQRVIGNGPSADEAVQFYPRSGMAYVFRMTGFELGRSGAKVLVTESLTMGPEFGQVAVNEEGEDYRISYSFAPEQVSQSRILNSSLFTDGLYRAFGRVTVNSNEGAPLVVLPVLIRN